MYLNFYGFTEIPFSISPNPRFIFYSKTHKEAFALLLYGINNRFGFIELTGEVGTGKTTVLRTLLSQLNEEQYRTALIFNPSLSAVDLMRAINHEYGIPSDSDNSAELLGDLNRFLLKENAAGRKVVLIIDEAQNLAPHVLEQVRLISNLETDTDKLIQIILAGQPELASLLEKPELRQINQRIALRYALQPLDRDDFRAYIDHRLVVSGGRDRVSFSRGALRLLFQYSRGTPRLINILCDRALLIGYTEGRREITARTVTLAFRDVMLKPPERFSPALRKGLAAALAGIVLMAAGWLYLSPARTSTAARPPAPPASAPGSPAPPAPSPVPAASRPVPADIRQAVRNELALRSEGKSAIQAFNAVAALWKAPPIRQLSEKTPLLNDLRRHAAKRQLEMTHFSGEMDELLRLDSPALLSLSPKESKGNFLVALTAIKEGKLLISPPLVGRTLFSREEIASLWSGHAWLLWRNRSNITFPLAPGDDGDGVEKLQKLLQSAGASSLEASGFYDTSTMKAVREFQVSSKIKATGTTGPITLLYLYRSVNGGSLPSLGGAGKGGGA